MVLRNSKVPALDKASEIEVRINSFAGPVISRCQLAPTGDWSLFKQSKANLDTISTGRHNLYFILLKPTRPNENILKLRSIGFEKAEK